MLPKMSRHFLKVHSYGYESPGLSVLGLCNCIPVQYTQVTSHRKLGTPTYIRFHDVDVRHPVDNSWIDKGKLSQSPYKDSH